MARQDVGLEVDAVAGDAVAEGRRLERLGDERDLEPLLRSRRRASASLTALTVSETPSTAIEPLSTTSGARCAGRRDAQHAPLRARAHLEQLAGAVDVTLHDVAAEAAVRGRRALEVDDAARARRRRASTCRGSAS